ncbi:unnamed protein product [Cylindrotheca closterium]|uniref:Uncharacterized protein n=1 Tax=Cylindrotheca closterium TaxID=2856 RepID=A0AAD2FJJ2_9STRA|nr:unnamed protein product [Cylindrotheca closterium]
MKILRLLSIACLVDEGLAAFLPFRLHINDRRSSFGQKQSNLQDRDPSSYRIREGLALSEQTNNLNEEVEWNDNEIIDTDASMAELELALAESQRKRAALEDELMASMAESVLNRTPQMALAELELAQANKNLLSQDLIKATTGLLGPIGGIVGVSAAGVVAGRNFLQKRQAKIEDMERRAYQSRLDAALQLEKISVQSAAQKAAAVTGIAALGVTLSGTLDEFSLPSLGGNSMPTISIKNEQQVAQKKLVEPKPELPYLEENIRNAELEVEAKEKAVLEATQKSQRAAGEAATLATDELPSLKENVKKAELEVQAKEKAILEATQKSQRAVGEAATLATAELPSLEQNIKKAELEVQAKEKAVLEATQKSQRLEQMLKTEEQASLTLQAQLKAAEEAAKMATARLSSAELAAKEAEARALAAERKATTSPAPITNIDMEKKEDNAFATRKKEEAESLDLKRRVAEGMLRPTSKATSPFSSKLATSTIATPTAGVAATAPSSASDALSKVTNNPAVLAFIGGGVAAAAGVATAIGAAKNKEDNDKQKKGDPVRATMKISTSKPKAKAKKSDELPFNIPPPPKEISSPSKVGKRGDDATKSSFASSKPASVEETKPHKSGTESGSSPSTTSKGPKGSPGPKTPKFISSYDGPADEDDLKSLSSAFNPGVDILKDNAFQTGPGASKFSKFRASDTSQFGPGSGAPKGSSPFQTDPGASKFASKFGASDKSPFGPGAGASKGSSPFQTDPGASKFASKFGSGDRSPFGPGAGASKGSSRFQTDPGASKFASKFGAGDRSPFGPGAGASKGSSPFQTDPGASKFPSSRKGASSVGASSKSSSKEESLFFTGPSTRSPLGPGFSAGPGVPKGFVTGPGPVNGQSNGVDSAESPRAGTVDTGGSQGFLSSSPPNGLDRGAPKGFPSSYSNETNGGNGGVKGIGRDPVAPLDSPGASPFETSGKGLPKRGSSFFTGTTTGSPIGPGVAPKGFGAGSGVPKGFPRPVNGPSSDLDTRSKAAENVAPDSFESGGLEAPKGFSSLSNRFASPVNGRNNEVNASAKEPEAGTVSSNGFGSGGPGVPNGFPNPANGQSSDLGAGSKGTGAGAGTVAPKGFWRPGGSQGSPISANGQSGDIGASPKAAEAGTVAPKPFDGGPAKPKDDAGQVNGQSNDTTASMKESKAGTVSPNDFKSGGPGVPNGFPNPANGQSRDLGAGSKGTGAGAGTVAPKGFWRPGGAKGSDSKGDSTGLGATKDGVSGSASANEFASPKTGLPFGSPGSAAKSSSGTSEVKGTSAFEISKSTAPSDFGSSSASFRPLSGGKSPAETNNSYTGARKREFKLFPKSGSSTVKKGAPASFDPFPSSRPDTPGGPTFPTKTGSPAGSSNIAGKPDGRKTFTSFTGKDGAEVITTRPFGNGPGKSLSGQSNSSGKKSFQPPKTGLKSPFQSSEGVAKKDFKPYSPKGMTNEVEKKSFKPYSRPAEAMTSEADLPAEFNPTFPPKEGVSSKGTDGASVSGSNLGFQVQDIPQSPATSVDLPASSSSYLSGMQGSTSKNQGVKSSYSPFGPKKKTEPSKSSTYSPLGQWTPGSSKADASANLGAPSLEGSKTDDAATEASATWASASVSGESSIAPSKAWETSKLNNDLPTASMESTPLPISLQENEQGLAQPGEASNGEQNTEEPQGSIWDTLSATVSSFTGRSTYSSKQATTASDTAEFPASKVRSSYSPFGPRSYSQGTPRAPFGVANTVDPTRNIVEQKRAIQGATSGNSPVKTSYAPFEEKESSYSPFGSASVPNPSEPQVVPSQGNANVNSPFGSWSPPVPTSSETTTNESGFSPFAEWLKNEPQPGQPATSTNASPVAAGANPVSTPQAPSENMASQNTDNPVYFSPNSPGAFSKQPPGRSYQPDQNGNQSGSVADFRRPRSTNSYGNRRVEDFRRLDEEATEPTSRYVNRAVDPTQSYRRPDPYLNSSSSNVPTRKQQYLNQERTMQQATGRQADPFYSSPYGTRPTTKSDQIDPNTETAAQRGRSGPKDSKPSNNWFDDGRGGKGSLNQDWQWNSSN